MWMTIRRPSSSRFTSEYRGQDTGSQLMVKMLELLKWQGYERASLAAQKVNWLFIIEGVGVVCGVRRVVAG